MSKYVYRKHVTIPLYQLIILVFFQYKFTAFMIISIFISIGLSLQFYFKGETFNRFGSLMVCVALIFVYINHYTNAMVIAFEESNKLFDKIKENGINKPFIRTLPIPDEKFTEFVFQVGLEVEYLREKAQISQKNVTFLEFTLGIFGTFIWGYGDLLVFYMGSFFGAR